MKKPLVLLDVDGVLADFVTPAFDVANKMFGTNHHPDHLDEWDMGKFMKLDKDQEHAWYNEIMKKGFHDHIKPYPGAVDGVNWLRKVSDLHIVTSPMFGETWCSERWKWLYDLFGIRGVDVTHTHAKQYFHGDFLIDDKPSNVEKWLTYWQERQQNVVGLLWHQWYTKKIDSSLTRVHDWHDVVRHVERGARR